MPDAFDDFQDELNHFLITNGLKNYDTALIILKSEKYHSY